MCDFDRTRADVEGDRYQHQGQPVDNIRAASKDSAQIRRDILAGVQLADLVEQASA